jgi:steroid delta-isomerase-like uncharacterized protein
MRRHDNWPRTLLLVLAALLAFFPTVAVTQEATPQPLSVEEKNSAVALQIYAAVNSDLDLLDALYSPDTIDHNPAPGQGAGFQGVKQSFQLLKIGFPDWKVTWYDVLAEGDYVVAYGIGRGTNTGVLYGIPPTGKSAAAVGTNIFRFENGKVVERWETLDIFGVLTQLGLIPPTPGLVAATTPLPDDPPVHLATLATVTQTAPDALAANKTLVERFYDAVNTGDMAVIDEVVGADVVNHQPPVGAPAGIEGIKQWVQSRRTGFPDGQFTIETLVAEGDKVAASLVFGGTNQGEFLGIPATGKRVEGARSLVVWRVADGKLVETWPVEDNLRFLTQLGLVPSFGLPSEATPVASPTS